MDISQWSSLISDVGFPVAVTLFVLLRVEKKLDLLMKALKEKEKREG